MTFPRARLTVAACLFTAWLGYLLLLVVLTRDTVVLSRPQFLVSDLWVLAEVADKDGKPAPKAKIIDIFWFKHPADRNLKDQTITIAYLPDAGPQGYKGPGQYILALSRREEAGVTSYSLTQVRAAHPYVAPFVNVWLMSAGTQPERVVQLAVEILGLDAEEARERVNVVKGGKHTTLRRAVPREQAAAFALAVADLGAKDAAEVWIEPDDVRIYPWTPETQEQIDELVRARG